MQNNNVDEKFQQKLQLSFELKLAFLKISIQSKFATLTSPSSVVQTLQPPVTSDDTARPPGVTSKHATCVIEKNIKIS